MQRVMTWFLYLLECADGSYYTGITNQLEGRILAHNQGIGARYTRGRGPVRLLEVKNYPNRSEASKAECAVKRLLRARKRAFFSNQS